MHIVWMWLWKRSHRISTQCALLVFSATILTSFKLKRFVFVVCMYVPMSNNKVTSLRDIDIYYSLMWPNTAERQHSQYKWITYLRNEMEWCVKVNGWKCPISYSIYIRFQKLLPATSLAYTLSIFYFFCSFIELGKCLSFVFCVTLTFFLSIFYFDVSDFVCLKQADFSAFSSIILFFSPSSSSSSSLLTSFLYLIWKIYHYQYWYTISNTFAMNRNSIATATTTAVIVYRIREPILRLLDGL